MTSTANDQRFPSGTWDLDPTTTTVTVLAKKLGFIPVGGALTVTEGTIEVDDDHRVVSVTVIANAASYESGIGRRDEKIRGTDFLDAANHPNISFRSTSVTTSDGSPVAHGTVTIAGGTSPIDLSVGEVVVVGERASIVATATIDRSAIGLGRLPSWFIGQRLELTASAVAVRRA